MSTAKHLIHPLPYLSDNARLFSTVAAKPWAIFLDSGYPYSSQGQFDIIVADPVTTLVTRGNETEIFDRGEQRLSTEDPFTLVKQYLGGKTPPIQGIPFNGGAIGYFSYDLSRRLENLPVIAKDSENIPEMMVGIYRWAVIVDHHRQQSYLVGQTMAEQQWKALIDQFTHVPSIQHKTFKVLAKSESNMDKTAYARYFSTIKHYLQEGDCYQVNLAQRFVSPCSGDPWTAYQYLRQINPAPFSSYLNLPGVQILSSSPERFLQVIGGDVETKPIKGTRPKMVQKNHDVQQINDLSESRKDRAENLMIVDLMRNDISKNCQLGSVTVPDLFAVESYTTVHHLVSTIKGTLESGQHALDLLRNCFPGGSITGTPKIRAMEIIEELEPQRRGVYCGSIGYIGFDGNMDSNIVIRTLVHSENRIRFWVGGGIVNDSQMEEEYQECFDKAAALLALLDHFSVNDSH